MAASPSNKRSNKAEDKLREAAKETGTTNFPPSKYCLRRERLQQEEGRLAAGVVLQETLLHHHV